MLQRTVMTAAFLTLAMPVAAQNFAKTPDKAQGPQTFSKEILNRGRVIASGGASHGGVRMKCMACHGLTGQGDGAAPRLAGLPRDYLTDQIASFAEGTRASATMAPIAIQLTPVETRAVTAWYSSQTPALRDDVAPSGADMRLIERGGALARTGMRSSGQDVTACVMCHGNTADAQSSAVPGLAGQTAPYIAAQLRAWQDGARRNDALGVMAQIAAQLTAEEIEAVAAYYANLPPQP